jgi:Na+/H+-dicarboxylate symporter
MLYADRAGDPVAAAALRAAMAQSSGTSPEIPTFGSWLTGLVPVNPVKAMVDGAMLPLIVFTVSFALALRSAPAKPREAVAAFFRGVADAMLVLVRWVLAAAWLGVGALALALGARLGVGAAGAVGYYLVVHGALLVFAVGLLYAVAWGAGRVPLRTFARAAVPAQAVAMSTRSSLAALPAMLEAATTRLGIPAETAAFVLPFAVSIFRLNLAVSWTVGALFLAQLYGVSFGTASVITVAASAVAMSFSVPGIPSGSLFIIAPILPLVGLPVEGVGVLIALDTLPDVLKTLLNVTGHLTATVLVTRDTPRAS